MIRYLTIWFFLFRASVEVFCQGTEVGLIVSPNYAYRKSNSEDNLRFIYEDEKPRLGFEYGLLLIHHLSNGWALESGLRHTRMGYSYGKQVFFNNDNTQAREVESFHQFDFLNIPLKIQMFWLKNSNVSPLVKLGLNNYFFIGEWIESENGKVKTNISLVSSYQLGISISIGVMGRLSDRLNCYFSPGVNYLPFSLYGKDNPIQKYLFSIGEGSHLRTS